MKFFIPLVLFVSFAHAGELGSEPKFLVKSVDGTDLKSLSASNVKVLPPHRGIANDSFLPSVADRDRIFQESGLLPKIGSWDDFEKDALYLKLQKKGKSPIERILLMHPDLDRASLENAQKLIAKEE